MDPDEPMTGTGPSDDPDQGHDGVLRLEAAREAITMALYQSLSLLAVMLASPNDTDAKSGALALEVLLTGLGLLAAHHIAFRLSSRLINQGLVTPESTALLKAQLIGGLPVVLLAAIPPLLLGLAGLLVSEVLLLGIVVATGYRGVRQAVNRGRALAYLVGLTVVLAAFLAFKTSIGH